jgi:hypothetical protein
LWKGKVSVSVAFIAPKNADNPHSNGLISIDYAGSLFLMRSPTVPIFFATIVCFTAIGSFPLIAGARTLATSDCTSVLFVGDSLTYVNNLPAIYRAIANSKGGCVTVAMVASGGESLREHWKTGDVVRQLQAHHWTFVVLQDQTTFGQVYLVNGKSHVRDARELFIYGRKLADRIRAARSVPVLFLPWTPRDMNPRDAEFVRWAYQSFGLKQQISIVPVGYAWRSASKNALSPALYLPDGSHPTAAGSYLAAAVFVTYLNKVNPEGAVSTVLGNAVDFDSRGVNRQSNVLLADIESTSALLLQKLAWDARLWVASGAERQPPPAGLPVLLAGRVLDPGSLNGEWVGRNSVYPYPATMRLTICEKPLAVKGVVDFGGRPDTITFADASPHLHRRTLTFIDARGPNGGRVRYTARLHGTNLGGIGEIIVDSAPIYAIGEWSLTRRKQAAHCIAQG